MDDDLLSAIQPVKQILFGIGVHQKAHTASIHAKYGYAPVHVPVQRMQHETVTTQGYDDIRFIRR